jgi:hypothetical protein
MNNHVNDYEESSYMFTDLEHVNVRSYRYGTNIYEIH